jgi:hypothetical protein
MSSTTHKEVLFGLYNDEEKLISAVKQAREAHLDIMDVYTPFPVHGLDPVLGLSESRLHVAGFVYGMTGTAVAFGFMTWVFTRDWPIIFGGKPYFSVPSFIPITFELTVLFACIGMVVTFYTICGMGPGVVNEVLDERITDDKFCIAFNTHGMGASEVDSIKAFFEKSGAEEVNSKSIY